MSSGFNESGTERVFILDRGMDYLGNKLFFEQVQQSKIFQDFLNDFTEDANGPAMQAVIRLYPGRTYVSESEFLDGLRTVVTSGDLDSFLTDEAKEARQSKRRKLAPENTDKRTPAQKHWASHALWMYPKDKDGNLLPGPSRREQEERKRQDPTFRAWLEADIRGDLAKTGVGDDVRAVNPQPEVNHGAYVSPELRKWAESFNKLPVREQKQRLLAAYNPTGYQLDKQNFEQASLAGLV